MSGRVRRVRGSNQKNRTCVRVRQCPPCPAVTQVTETVKGFRHTIYVRPCPDKIASAYGGPDRERGKAPLKGAFPVARSTPGQNDTSGWLS
jgi:hypothetical protein